MRNTLSSRRGAGTVRERERGAQDIQLLDEEGVRLEAGPEPESGIEVVFN